MLLRLRCSEGQARIEVNATDSGRVLRDKVNNHLKHDFEYLSLKAKEQRLQTNTRIWRRQHRRSVTIRIAMTHNSKTKYFRANRPTIHLVSFPRSRHDRALFDIVDDVKQYECEQYRKILEAFKQSAATGVKISKSPNVNDAGSLDVGKTVSSLSLGHGDLIHVWFSPALDLDEDAESVAKTTAQESASIATGKVIQEAVDDILEKDPGLIQRGKDRTFCKHGPNGMCDYCMPLEPYDAKFLSDRKIKHMSFHAHLRKIASSSKKSITQGIPILEEVSFSMREDCNSGHKPFPEGVCSKCQPSSIVLQSQPFRMVDHVEFESASIVDSFLHAWRVSGKQRFGYMIGRYERFTPDEKGDNGVPLGIKAVVCAIYEPAQRSSNESIHVDPFPDLQEEEVSQLAEALGLKIVGQIYTDLTDDGTEQGSVICKRHAGSYFLSSAEIVFIADQQSKRPSNCRFSSSGKFGSKFVTVVVTGNEEGKVDLYGYQVSNAAVAMYEANLLQSSANPTMMLVKEAAPSSAIVEARREGRKPLPKPMYVPEIFFKHVNEYNAAVQVVAKPAFPVEYLLVTLTHGFPSIPKPTFVTPTRFPIEHREREPQNISVLRKHLLKATSQLKDIPKLLEIISDFHLLLHIQSMHIFSPADWKTLLEAVRANDVTKCYQATSTPSWGTFESILGDEQLGDHFGPDGAESWACVACSFVNMHSASRCQMCETPKPVVGFNTGQESSSTAGSSSSNSASISAGNSSSSGGDNAPPAPEEWQCIHCTFINSGRHVDCKVCGLPKQ